MKKKSSDEREPLAKTLEKLIRESTATWQMALATFIALLMVTFISINPRLLAFHQIIGVIILYIIIYYFCFVYLCSYRATGKILNNNEVYLLSVLTALYFISAKLFSIHLSGYMPCSIAMPTALIVMLIAIMISSRLAKVMAILLPLGAFMTGFFDVSSYFFALASGISAVYVLRSERRRMDMVKAGAAVAVINVIAASAILMSRTSYFVFQPIILFWAAINGIASAMLVLGITPLLENMLHCATSFKLIELLDLGAPLMRQLAQKTPGTFSHSMLVANLAEAACQEIGARALLARAGAYYHDIGKIDQPEYFVENQHNDNKHDDLMNPRLSATVIRSHVKLGIERGRSIGLPNEVIDIIATHHGNSLISYFYYEALKKEGEVNKEDFCYPGNPPRAKEAAVVMLADITEAAVRTLDKPSTSRLEKFIDELISKKVDAEQLADCELTFRELETIKKVFVRVLTGYYHSRIEYPKIPASGTVQKVEPNESS
ncbi:MAG: HDIG domain-containing protein [Spirochaetaceae bacterium]|jgi:putative nucleotidyltransferase with HDIG domain|nr:HDIG domain-containing protein [Spirochaetaceae bacterium]